MPGDVESRSGVVPAVLREHLREAALLHATRAAVSSSPAASLSTLARRDQRLAAHIDGLVIGGSESAALCRDRLDGPAGSDVFPAAVLMLHAGDRQGLEQWLRAGEESAEVATGLRDALEWVHREHLRGVVVDWRRSESATQRMTAIDACVVHGTDAGLARFVDDGAPRVRARALRAAAEQGRRDLAERCLAATEDEDPDCRFWGAWSAVLLGEKDALAHLEATAAQPGPHQSRAFRLMLQRSSLASGHASLQRLSKDANERRRVIEGSGLVGDPKYVTWLIGQMAAPETARLAGEALTNIVGLDLFQGFEVARPEGFDTGPSEDPEDEPVALDPDEGLPWPDVAKVQAWWVANGVRFQPGQRYLIGGPVTREHCGHVLKHGFQRQRILAAHCLCLLNPGTPLFNTAAPAWRQQRLFAGLFVPQGR